MAIDYVIDRDCPVKQELTLDGLIDMIKDRNRALAAYDFAKGEGKADEEARRETINFKIMTPTGPVDKETVTVDEMLKRSQRLDSFQAQCKQCNLTFANMRLALKIKAEGGLVPFGCYRSVNYPVSAKAEEWLVKLAEDALKEGGIRRLALDYIVDNKVTGDDFARMRAHPGGAFLQLKKPLEITVSKGLFNKKTVNTNQLLSMMFGFSRVVRAQMITLLYFSGAFAIADKKPEGEKPLIAVQATGADKQTWYLFKDWPDDADDKSIVQLKDYFWSMFFAYLYGQDMLVSM